MFLSDLNEQFTRSTFSRGKFRFGPTADIERKNVDFFDGTTITWQPPGIAATAGPAVNDRKLVGAMELTSNDGPKFSRSACTKKYRPAAVLGQRRAVGPDYMRFRSCNASITIAVPTAMSRMSAPTRT